MICMELSEKLRISYILITNKTVHDRFGSWDSPVFSVRCSSSRNVMMNRRTLWHGITCNKLKANKNETTCCSTVWVLPASSRKQTVSSHWIYLFHCKYLFNNIMKSISWFYIISLLHKFISVSQYSDSLRPRGPGFDSRKGQDFSLLYGVQPGSGSQPAPIQWVPGAISTWIKRQGREDDNSPPPFSAEVKNGGAVPALPHILHGTVLIN
jgi:hypothetical protein